MLLLFGIIGSDNGAYPGTLDKNRVTASLVEGSTRVQEKQNAHIRVTYVVGRGVPDMSVMPMLVIKDCGRQVSRRPLETVDTCAWQTTMSLAPGQRVDRPESSICWRAPTASGCPAEICPGSVCEQRKNGAAYEVLRPQRYLPRPRNA
jgi:hypothetical protein